jgi:erythromycin esterase-like protein
MRRRRPARIVVAVPTAAAETCEQLRNEADEVICAITPEPFLAVGRWYEEFTQTTDEEVRELLAQRDPAGEPAARGSADTLANRVHAAAHRLTGAVQDYNPLIELIGDAEFVLLGGASHGTHEFYRERALITRRLVEEKGFAAVAVEADWPDAYRVNRFIRGRSDDVDAIEALSDFRRFPTWMWRNTDVVEFVDWMRRHNDATSPDRPLLGFYGLDLYSLHASMKAVLGYLEKVDPKGAKRARERFACFDHFGDDVERYGFLTSAGLAAPCEREVVSQLVELERNAMDYARRGVATAEEHFFAQMNALVVKNAEAYYRTMFLERVSSWNLRDLHMMQTLEALAGHLRSQGVPPKIVVWAHNSHLGDARATQMGAQGELNLGQLVREKWGPDAVLVGFTTHHGTVSAASDWGSPVERKNVPPALPGSWEALLHESGLGRFLLTFPRGAELTRSFRDQKLERAIGVIYRPETERASHYFAARLSDQFDAVVHFDESRALEPLERTAAWEAGDVPETFPFAV